MLRERQTLCAGLGGGQVRGDREANGTRHRSVVLWAIDPGRGIALEANDVLRLALVHGFARAGKLSGHAALLVTIPAPHEKYPGARCKQDEKLRHG